MKRRSLLLAALALVAVGCGGPPSPPQPASLSVAAAETAKQPVPPPNFNVISNLGIAHGAGFLQVGQTMDDSRSFFGPPPGSYEKSDLPPSLTEPYEARGWQTKDEGFGAILYKGRIAAALYQKSKASRTQVDELVKTLQDRFGPPKLLSGTYVDYWFWNSDEPNSDQILMVCATEAQPEKFELAEAVGASVVMRALGMVQDVAAMELDRADRLIERSRRSRKAISANSPNPAGS